MLPLRVLSGVLAWGIAGAPPTQRDEVRVLLWSDTPAIVAELPTAIDGRFVPADREAFAAALDRARDDGDAVARTEQAALDAALVAAREQWLAQQWDQLAAGVAAIERDHLAWLADPRRCDTLWEIELRRALAARGSKDIIEAERRIAFALALAPDRRPPREIYGPELVAQFAAAADARSARVPTSIVLDVTPRHAEVHVDCEPVRTARVELRPGLHVVHARAMGSVAAAVIFEVPAAGRVELALANDGEGDAVARLARGLAHGPLVPQLAAHRRALVDAAASRDIDVVIVVEAAGDAVVARALVGEAKGATQRRPSVEAAVAAALATVADDGTLRGATPAVVVTDAPPPKPRKPLVRAWWLWTSVAVVVATGLGLGLGLGLKDRKSDRLVIFGPQ